MERPTGVTILAILGFIATGLMVLTGILMFLGGALFSSMASRPGFAMLGGIGGVIIGVVCLGFAALYLVTALGLWKLQNWARLLIIVLVGIGLLFNALGLLGAIAHVRMLLFFQEAIVLAIDAWIVLYLLKPHVKQAFGATGF